MRLFGKSMRKKFYSEKLLFLLYLYALLEGNTEKKIKMFFSEFVNLQSEKREIDLFVFLRLLLNFYREEAATRKEVIKALYDVIFCCDKSISSNSSSGASCKGVSQDEMESLPCVPSKYASCIAVVDLLGCILIVWVLFSMICVWAGGAPALQLLHCVIAVAEYVRCSKQCISYILVREQCDCENGLLVLDDLVMVLSVV